MNKLKFKKTETGNSWVESNEDKYLLLGYFIGDYSNSSYIQSNIIEPLEKILKDEKSFGEIMEGFAEWDFDDGHCILEVEEKTAYFVNERDSSQNLEMPLEEVVSYLKKWKSFLETKHT
ncbi:hypothetical protein [Psychroserpens sp. MEBiC05023]